MLHIFVIGLGLPRNGRDCCAGRGERAAVAVIKVLSLLPSPFPFPLVLSPLPLNPARMSSGVWGAASAEIELGAF